MSGLGFFSYFAGLAALPIVLVNMNLANVYILDSLSMAEGYACNCWSECWQMINMQYKCPIKNVISCSSEVIGWTAPMWTSEKESEFRSVIASFSQTDEFVPTDGVRYSPRYPPVAYQ